MRFRPCIDIHNGQVKQIVGSSLKDEGDAASENYVATQDAAWFARKYAADHLHGGHVILLNPESSPYYEATRQQALGALQATPGLLQIGGGIRPDNAQDFLTAGASHVIVTSYVFKDGEVNRAHLEEMRSAVGRDHLVLDLSCRRKGDQYYIVTDRWQKMTNVALSVEVLDGFASYCSELLVHAVDVEGKASGIEEGLAQLLGSWNGLPVTYAGGIGSMDDLRALKEKGQGRLDFTIGSALDLFGGTMSYARISSEFCK